MLKRGPISNPQLSGHYVQPARDSFQLLQWQAANELGPIAWSEFCASALQRLYNLRIRPARMLLDLRLDLFQSDRQWSSDDIWLSLIALLPFPPESAQ